MKYAIIAAATAAGFFGTPLRAQDAERATHADLAATPQLSFERSQGGVTLRQYQLGCLSQLTYLIVSQGEALVVDPQRDVEHYLRDAAELGAQIRHVLLTHTNADFVAGHTELAARTGAEILISADSGSLFPHRGMRDGERLQLGAASIEFLATPGHTLDSMTLLVHVPGAEADPLYALTGDALFIGSIGRPDLAQGALAPSALASRAFDSIQRLRALDRATIVLPAHGAGSLCGAHLSPDTSSTIGRELETNPYLQIDSRAAFVARDISGLPPAPQYFAYNVALNRAGPPVVDWSEATPKLLTPEDLARETSAGAWVIDLRDARQYSAAHIEGSVNVAVRGRVDTWTGIVVPFEAPLILVGSPELVREAAFRFKRIGLDKLVGYVDGTPDALRASGAKLRTTELVSPEVLADQIARGAEPIVVDVRTPEEHAELAIGEYVLLPLTDWRRFGEVLDPAEPVLFVCNSAYRSSMAVGLAERQGFQKLASLAGGLDAWLSAGQKVFGSASVCSGPLCPPALAHETAAATIGSPLPALPEAVEPAALAQALIDQPQSYALVDVRTPWQFEEYHLPGAVNVAPEALSAHLASLPARTRIVVLDRDGTLAYACAAFAACQLGDAAPALRVLSGGTARYWREVEIGSASPAGATAPTTLPATIATTPASATPAAKAVKKRSAGC